MNKFLTTHLAVCSFCLFYSLIPVNVNAQESDNQISDFSLSINPLGFIQFGPIINAEFGVSENLVLNTHLRAPAFGVLSYVLYADEDGLDQLNGIAVGAGLLKFLGENQSKFYAGGFIDYQRTTALYADSEQWEWEETDNTIIFAFNGGYRFRFDGGFFVNTGVYLGGFTSNYEWDYTNTESGGWANDPNFEGETGTAAGAFGMVELTLGIEF